MACAFVQFPQQLFLNLENDFGDVLGERELTNEQIGDH